MPVNLKGLDVARTIDIESARAMIKVTEKKPGSAVQLKDAQVEEIPVEIELQGKFSNFVSFILGISSNSQITRVKSFRISSIDSKRDPTDLRINATIVGYRSLPPETESTTEGGPQ
jgi:Tfp pilus assembly protein PilO